LNDILLNNSMNIKQNVESQSLFFHIETSSEML